MRRSFLLVLLTALFPAAGCDGCRGGGGDAIPVPSSADPEGKDLVVGAVVAAEEKGGGMRLYKIAKVNWFPDPVGEELEMLAYAQTGASFAEAAKLWREGRLTVELPKVRVPRHVFIKRDHRVLARETVSARELEAKAGDAQRAPGEPAGR